MPFEPDLQVGQEIVNGQLCHIFKCSTQGGMRRSHETGTLVIVSKHIDKKYDDRWIDEKTLHYTGMGLQGDQSINSSQNQTLNESATNGVDVHIFEVFEKGKYTYRGRVFLLDHPYQEQQPDENGNIRNVWMFPLRIIDDSDFHIPFQKQLTVFESKEKEAKRLSDNELRKRIQYSSRTPGYRKVASKSYERNPWVSEYAKRRANGICQLCDQPAPFFTNDRKPYLETHHIIWLSKSGDDTPENTVALCPNCHRRMHSLNKNLDRNKLIRAVNTDK